MKNSVVMGFTVGLRLGHHSIGEYLTTGKLLNMNTRNLSDIPVARGDGEDFPPDVSRFLITASSANHMMRFNANDHPCSGTS